MKLSEEKFYKKLSIGLIFTYSIFIIFDGVCLFVDSGKVKSESTLTRLSELFLVILDTLILVAYAILFIVLLRLFQQKEGTLDSFKCQIITFFSIVITMLTFRTTLSWLYFWFDAHMMITTLFDLGTPKGYLIILLIG